MDRSIDILDLIGDIYEASHQPQHWRLVLEKVCTLLNARSGGLFIQEKHHKFNSAFHTYNFPKFARIAYNLGLGSLDPGFKIMEKLPVGVTKVIVGDGAEVSPIYQKLMLDPVGVNFAIGLNIFNDEEWHVGLGLHRSNNEGPFSIAEIDIISKLYPHFQRALRIQKEIVQLRNQQKILTSCLDRISIGIVILDKNSAIHFMNPVAQSIIDSILSIYLDSNGLLSFKSIEDSHKFISAIDNILHSGSESESVSIHNPDLKYPIALIIKPFRECQSTLNLPIHSEGSVVVYLSNPNGESTVLPDVIKATYGLSDAESRLVIALTNGLSLESFAKHNHVSLHTVKTQLKSIFLKINVSRQQDLIRVVLRTSI